MSLEKLKEQLAAKSLGRLYYIYGDEAYLKHFYIGQMKKCLFDEESVKLDFTEFDASVTTEDFFDCVNSFPTIAEKKMILLTDIPEKSELCEALPKNADSLNDDTVVVFFAQTSAFSKKTTAGKAMLELFAKHGLSVEVKRLDAQTLKKWIAKQFRLNDREISEETVSYLLAAVGDDMFALYGECQKLSAYCEKEITQKAIDEICIKNVTIKVFEITDAILRKDMSAAYTLAESFMSGSVEDYIYLSAVLFNFVGTLYKTKVLSEAGMKPFEIAKELEMKNDYVVKKYSKMLSGISLKRLGTLVDKCTQADLTMKSTSTDPRVVLTALIEELAI